MKKNDDRRKETQDKNTKQEQTDNKAKQQKRLKGKNVDNFWTIVCILAPYVNHGEINFLPKITAT